MMFELSIEDRNSANREIYVNAGLNVLTILVVCLRFYSRRLTRVGFGWDDACVLIATVTVNTQLSLLGCMLHLGYGLPLDDIPPENLKRILKIGHAFPVLFLICICFVKLSALFFYMRVFCTPVLQGNRRRRPNSPGISESGSTSSSFDARPLSRSCWGSIKIPCLRTRLIAFMWVIVVWSVANIIQELVVCISTTPMCHQKMYSDLSICLFNANSDVVVFVLPLWPIWRLQMRTSAKIGLTIIFLLGLVTVVVAFLRFDAIVKTAYGGDWSKTGLRSSNYAIIEPNLSVLCISLPMLQPLLRKLFSGLSTGWIGRVARRASNLRGRRPARRFATLKEDSTGSSATRSFTGSRAMPPKGTDVNIPLCVLPPSLKRSGNDGGVTRSAPGDRNADGNAAGEDSFTSKARALWNSDSYNSSQVVLGESSALTVETVVSVTTSAATPLDGEDPQRPPIRASTTTTITGGTH